MRVLVTADDFGISKSTNEAIIEGVAKGVITSTNVMVNMPYWQDIQGVIKEYKELSVGIHLNLTTGCSTLKREYVQTLVDENGAFWDYENLKNRLSIGKISLKEVRHELKNQIRIYREVIGDPAYWNTHNHIHMLPQFYFTFVKVASEEGIFKMRNNYKMVFGDYTTYSAFKNAIIKVLYRYARGKGMQFPDGIGYFKSENEKTSIQSYYSHMNKDDEQVEFVFHVAKEVDSLFLGKKADQRIIERCFIMSSDFKNFLNQNEKCGY